MENATGPRGGCTIIFFVLLGALVFSAWSAFAHAAPFEESVYVTPFGTFSKAYIDRRQAKRWREMCKTGGRYDARREAYDQGKPDPCSNAKGWVR